MSARHVAGAEADVAVIGLGFVGLPAALMFARSGKKTIGVDIDAGLLDKLHRQECPINEPEMIALFGEPAVRASFSCSASVPVADAYVIAVPTPLHHRKKVADLEALCAATRSVVPALRKGALVVVESTIPPLTCDEQIRPILESTGLQVGRDILLAHCPERLYPGNVVHEIVNNDRIIGGTDAAATVRARELYATFVKGELLATDALTAEFCKLIENTYRDVNIALANELSLVAERLGTSIDKAIELANRHPRVSLLKPGIGVGGHCIPIDPWFIAEVAPEESLLIPMARRINDRMPEITAARIRKAVAHVDNPAIAVYGLTYKPDVNDLRESPAQHVVELLRKDGFSVSVCDPIAGVGGAKTLGELADGHDALVVLVPHDAAKKELAANRERIRAALRSGVLLVM